MAQQEIASRREAEQQSRQYAAELERSNRELEHMPMFHRMICRNRCAKSLLLVTGCGQSLPAAWMKKGGIIWSGCKMLPRVCVN